MSLPALFCGAGPLEHTVLLQVGNRAKDTQQVSGRSTQAGLLTALKQKLSADDMADLVRGFSRGDDLQGVITEVEAVMYGMLDDAHDADFKLLREPFDDFTTCINDCMGGPSNMAQIIVEREDHKSCREIQAEQKQEQQDSQSVFDNLTTSGGSWNEIEVPVVLQETECVIDLDTINQTAKAEQFIKNYPTFVEVLTKQWGAYADLFEKKTAYDDTSKDCRLKQEQFEMSSCSAYYWSESCFHDVSVCHQRRSADEVALCQPYNDRAGTRFQFCHQTVELTCILKEWGNQFDNDTVHTHDIFGNSEADMTIIRKNCQVFPPDTTRCDKYNLDFATELENSQDWRGSRPYNASCLPDLAGKPDSAVLAEVVTAQERQCGDKVVARPLGGGGDWHNNNYLGDVHGMEANISSIFNCTDVINHTYDGSHSCGEFGQINSCQEFERHLTCKCCASDERNSCRNNAGGDRICECTKDTANQ